MAAAAYAQSTGTITIGGSIPSAISITNDTNGSLSPTMTLGALVAGNSSALAMLNLPVNVRLRSNQQFKLNAAATFTNSGPGAVDGGTSISASDIGFGITAKDVSGASVVSARGLDAITGKFDYITTAFSALPVTNGKTPFDGTNHGTLNEISSSTQIMTGNRISKLGNIQSDDNFMLLTFNAGTLPQYFTPTTGFSAVITLTPVVF
jgi:hypothetical protein